MEFLLVTPYYPPMVSGAGKYCADLAAGLSKSGHRVKVLTCGEIDSVADKHGVTVETIRPGVRGATSVRMIRRGIARNRQQKFDLIISGIAYPTGAVAGVIARAARRPLVVLALGEEVSVARTNAATRFGLRRVLTNAKLILTPSSFTRQEVIDLGGSAQRCVVIPPGIDPRLFRVEEGAGDTFRARYGLTERRVVLTVARLEARKGHDVILRAVAQLASEFADIHYLVVGAGDPRPLTELAAELQVANRLTVIDFLMEDDLAVAYAAADVFAMASRPGGTGEVEGFGIVYLEAAAAGLACVAGNRGGCTDAVVDGVTGYCVEPTDPGAVADALRKLLSSKELNTRLGSEGRRRVAAEFDRSALQERTASLVTEAARRSPSRAAGAIA